MKLNTNITYKIVIFILICILLFVTLRTCRSVKDVSNIKTVTTSDTTYITHVDTIPFYNLKDSIRWHNLPVIVKHYNTDSTEYNYQTAIEDSLIGGTIYTLVTNTGELKNQSIAYVPKFPKYIHRTDSVIINNNTTTTITIEEKDWGIYGGVMLSPYNTFSMIGTVGVKTKKDMYYGIGYSPITNNIFLDIKVKLFKR